MKKQTWSFKPNRRPLPIPAKKASNELRRIHKKFGELKAGHVVAESKPTLAVLHPCFEWNDAKAATEFRLHQARNIINIVQVTTTAETGRKSTVPEFINVHAPTEEDSQARVYQPVEIAMNDPETRRGIMEACLNKLLMVRDNYRNLLEFNRVWAAIDELDAELVKV